MITESIIKVLHFTCLALTPADRWGAVGHPFNASSAAEGWLTVFAMVALIVSVILVLWLISQYRRTEARLRRELEGLGLSVAIDELRDEIAQLRQQEPAEAPEQMPPEESEEPVVIQES